MFSFSFLKPYDSLFPGTLSRLSSGFFVSGTLFLRAASGFAFGIQKTSRALGTPLGDVRLFSYGFLDPLLQYRRAVFFFSSYRQRYPVPSSASPSAFP